MNSEEVERKPEKLPTIIPVREIKQEVEDDDENRLIFDTKSEDVGIQNPEKVVKTEVPPENEYAPETRNPGEPERKRTRLEECPEGLPPPILRNCFMCRVPKEMHELRRVADIEESVSIEIGWILKGCDPLTNRSIIDKFVCKWHYHEAVYEIFTSLQISSAMFIVRMLEEEGRGDEIRQICEQRRFQMSIEDVRNALYSFCRKNDNRYWTAQRTKRDETQRNSESNQPGTSPSSSSSSDPSKPRGSRKRKSREISRPIVEHRCSVCSLPKKASEMQEIDIENEELILMVRCVISDDLPLAKAWRRMQTDGPKFTCAHHLMGTVREMYRLLNIESSDQLPNLPFDPAHKVWRFARELRANITPQELKEQLYRFCRTNETREKFPRFEIPYESVSPSFSSSEWSSRTLLPEIGSAENNSRQYGVEEEEEKEEEEEADSSIEEVFPSEEQDFPCSICGERRPAKELKPLVSRGDQLVVLIVWIINGGLSIDDARHFLNLRIDKLMCPHHAKITVQKVYEYLAIASFSHISLCDIPPNHRFMTIVRDLCRNVPLSENRLKAVLSEFCKRYDDARSVIDAPGAKENMVVGARPAQPDAYSQVACSICLQPKLQKDLRRFRNADEKLVVMIKCVLCNYLSAVEALNFLKSNAPQSACHKHFVDTVNHMFTSFEISKISEIPQCSDEKIERWMDVATMLRSNIQTSSLKNYLHSFCHFTTINGIQRAGCLPNPTVSLPPAVSSSSSQKSETCPICQLSRFRPFFRHTSLDFERLLLSIGWVLMGRWGVSEGVKFCKAKGLVFVCWEHFGEVIDGVFKLLKVNKRSDLEKHSDELREKLMFVVNSIHPEISMEAFQRDLINWTTKNQWCLALWRARNRFAHKELEDSQVVVQSRQSWLTDASNTSCCSLCSEMTSNENVTRVNLRRDKLILMIAWTHGRDYGIEDARDFATPHAHRIVCKSHLGEAMDIIFKYLEVSSVDDIPRVLNKPLAHLLRLSQEIVRRKKNNLLADLFTMIKDFYAENIREKTNGIQTLPSTSSSSSASSVTAKAVPLETCSLCLEPKPRNSMKMTSQRSEKLLLAVGWMLMERIEISDALRFLNENLQFFVCWDHFGEVDNRVLEELNIKNRSEFAQCSEAMKQKLMVTVHSLNPQTTLDNFWRFFDSWNWKNRWCVVEPTAPRRHEKEVNEEVIETPSASWETCTLCKEPKSIENLRKVTAKLDKLMLMVAWVMHQKLTSYEAKAYMNNKTPENVCVSHLKSAIDMILHKLEVEKIHELTKVKKNIAEKLLITLHYLCDEIRPSMSGFQRMVKSFQDTHHDLFTVITPAAHRRGQLPRVLQGGVVCDVCSQRRRKQELKLMVNCSERLVILVGCVLNGTCQPYKAKSLLLSDFVHLCGFHCPAAIRTIRESLGDRNKSDGSESDTSWISDDVMATVKYVRPDYTSEQFAVKLREVLSRN